MLFYKLKEFMKGHKFADETMLAARQIASWKSKINNSSETESVELCTNAGPSAFQLQESMLKSVKI